MGRGHGIGGRKHFRTRNPGTPLVKISPFPTIHPRGHCSASRARPPVTSGRRGVARDRLKKVVDERTGVQAMEALAAASAVVVAEYFCRGDMVEGQRG